MKTAVALAVLLAVKTAFPAPIEVFREANRTIVRSGTSAFSLAPMGNRLSVYGSGGERGEVIREGGRTRICYGTTTYNLLPMGGYTVIAGSDGSQGGIAKEGNRYRIQFKGFSGSISERDAKAIGLVK